MNSIIILSASLTGYLIGSVSAAIIVCRLMGLQDPRTFGSNNPGATNVLRLGGRKAAIITLFGDAAKGLLPVIAVRLALNSISVPENTVQAAIIGAGLGAFFGHLYPLFFGFKGGKGIATAFGVLLGVSWPVWLATVVSWLLVAAIFRYSSLAALLSYIAVPFYFYLIEHSLIHTGCFAVMSLFIIWRHRSNIQNLYHGTEDKIGGPEKQSN